MGWTGTRMYNCPRGKARIEEAIRQEGYCGSDGNTSWDVLDSALVGSTVYLAVHYRNIAKEIDTVYGVVILTSYRDHEFCTKAMSEDVLPYGYDCPKRILDLLSPTDNDCALEWRSRCAESRTMKNRDPLARLPFGARIRITGDGDHNGDVLEAYRYGKRKVFVNWLTRKYMTPKMVRGLGYEIVTA